MRKKYTRFFLFAGLAAYVVDMAVFLVVESLVANLIFCRLVSFLSANVFSFLLYSKSYAWKTANYFSAYIYFFTTNSASISLSLFVSWCLIYYGFAGFVSISFGTVASMGFNYFFNRRLIK